MYALYKSHPNYIKRRSSVADGLCGQARYTEAEMIYRQILAIYEYDFGKEHKNYTNTLHDLAYCLYLQEQHKAEQEQKRQSFDVAALG